MNSTRLTLLQQASGGDESAWRRVVAIYQPLIRGWLVGRGVEARDADDLAQDVMAQVVQRLPRFDHAGRTGSFRAWLRTIAVRRAFAYRDARRLRTAPTGGSEFLQHLHELEDSTSDAAVAWDAEHNRHVYRRLFEFMEQEFEPKTILAFRRLVVDEAKPADVAAETGMTVAAVYMAKSRVLARLRQEAGGLLD